MTEIRTFADELVPLKQALELEGRSLLDLGCGTGGLCRRIASETGAASVTGIDAHTDQIARAREKSDARVSFHVGRAEALPLETASMDVAVLMKSLHHVPIPSMGAALSELARVLVPGGQAYICEPAYEGNFNDIMRIFHDEGPERVAALTAIEQAIDTRVFALADRFDYLRPLAFSDLEDFRSRMMNLPWLKSGLTPAVEAEVACQWALHARPDAPVDFESRMLVFVLQKSRA